LLVSGDRVLAGITDGSSGIGTCTILGPLGEDTAV
jgi:hypothetical protein